MSNEIQFYSLGATGLAQCAELTWQLRGEAEKRQVSGAKLALQHNIGLGGSVVVALYRLGFPSTNDNASKSKLSNKTSGNEFSANGEGFQVTPYLRVLETAMQEDQDNLIDRVRGIYGFRVTHGPNGATGYWIINAKTGKGSVTYNGKEKPDVTFVMKDADVVELISGKLQAQRAFFQVKYIFASKLNSCNILASSHSLTTRKIFQHSISNKLNISRRSLLEPLSYKYYHFFY